MSPRPSCRGDDERGGATPIYSVSQVDFRLEAEEAPDEALDDTACGRCVLPPQIFDILAHTAPGAGGEIQLTDAMCELARTESMIAVDFTGKRYDMGNKLGVMQAQVEVALKHPEIGESFRAYLKELAKTL